MYTRKAKRIGLTTAELTVFAMLGTIMYLSKFLTAALPNIHLLALFIAAFTLTYRAKALIPLYVYILIEGVSCGFAMWWMPYLYIWAALWGAVMLISRLKLPRKFLIIACMIVCGLHGLSFGTMYAPAQALMYGLNLKQTMAWIAAGLWFDVAHGVGDFFAAALVFPLHELLKKLEKSKAKIF